jgi:hypothetical protein
LLKIYSIIVSSQFPFPQQFQQLSKTLFIAYLQKGSKTEPSAASLTIPFGLKCIMPPKKSQKKNGVKISEQQKKNGVKISEQQLAHPLGKLDPHVDTAEEEIQSNSKRKMELKSPNSS